MNTSGRTEASWAEDLVAGWSQEERRAMLAALGEPVPRHPLEDRWGVPAEVILDAIGNAGDLSQRGVLGLIAEASFGRMFLQRFPYWRQLATPGNAAYDFLLEREGVQIRVQVKRQRLERHQPRMYRRGSGLYSVETQRTRTGRHDAGGASRPYRFGEFDILAVSMQPATDDWGAFRLAPQPWLLARPEAPELLRVMQPVSLRPNADWTADLDECVSRLQSGPQRRVSETS